MSFSHFAFLMKFSSLIRQPMDAAGKYPHLVSGANLEEPSPLMEADIM